MTTMYYEADAKPELLKSKKIAILGYGSRATPTRSTCTTALRRARRAATDSSSIAKAEASDFAALHRRRLRRGRRHHVLVPTPNKSAPTTPRSRPISRPQVPALRHASTFASI